MTSTLPTPPATRPRWRSFLAALALVSALVVTASAVPALANEIGTGPGVVNGAVTDADGQPIQDVFVSASVSAGEGTAFWAYTYTDAAGRYEFTDLALGYTYGMSVQATGYQNEPWQDAVLTELSPTATVDFVLVPFAVGNGVISGQVTGDGAPLADIYVSISSDAGQSLDTVTDENGFYEFTGLANGAWNIYAFAGERYRYLNLPVIELTDSAPNATVDLPYLSWPAGTGTISGQVTGDGVPLAETYVSISSSIGQNLSTVTDENGFYEFTGLANGAWNIHAFPDGDYQIPYVPVIQLTDSAPNATVDLPYLSWPVGTSSISGVVTDAATGEPIAGVSVHASSEDAPHNSPATTDANGVFTFDLLPEGTYTLSFWASGYLITVTSEIQLLVDSHVTVDRALVAANATISGHVKTKNGAPAVGVSVDAYTVEGNWVNAVTDENGNYVINEVGATEYTVSLGGLGTPYTYKERIVTPVANGTVTANFTLKDRKAGSLSGFVVGPDGEWYLEGVCVKLYSSEKKKPVAETATWGPEYGDSSYNFWDVKPGSYTVEFEDCDDDPFKKFDDVFLGGATTYQDATFVTVAAGQDSWENNITLAYRAPNSTISGHVAKPNGTPIAGLTVQATDGTVSVGTVTDADGDYTFSGLFSGKYTVSVGGAGTPYAHKQKSVTVDENGSATANFTLGKR